VDRQTYNETRSGFRYKSGRGFKIKRLGERLCFPSVSDLYIANNIANNSWFGFASLKQLNTLSNNSEIITRREIM